MFLSFYWHLPAGDRDLSSTLDSGDCRGRLKQGEGDVPNSIEQMLGDRDSRTLCFLLISLLFDLWKNSQLPFPQISPRPPGSGGARLPSAGGSSSLPRETSLPSALTQSVQPVVVIQLIRVPTPLPFDICLSVRGKLRKVTGVCSNFSTHCHLTVTDSVLLLHSDCAWSSFFLFYLLILLIMQIAGCMA